MKHVLLSLLAFSLLPIHSPAADDYKGDVTDVRVVRHMDQHPGASLLWEPYIALWKPKQLIVAYGAGIPGKTDMGDIFASVSTDDGDTWNHPVCVFDHNQRFGTIQFAYANAILFHPPGQDVVWCFAMRCPMNFKPQRGLPACRRLTAPMADAHGRPWSSPCTTAGPLIVVAGIMETDQWKRGIQALPAAQRIATHLRSTIPLGSRDQFILSSTSLLEWKFEGFIPQPESRQSLPARRRPCLW